MLSHIETRLWHKQSENDMELATDLLVRAVKYDNDNRKVEALSLYTEGINKLLDVAKGMRRERRQEWLDHHTITNVFAGEQDATKKQHYHKKIEEFLKRAEVLKTQQAEDLSKRKIVKEIHIAENATGYSYQKLFGKFLDGGVREIIIEEPYLGRPFQMYNLVMFIELSVLNCNQLKIIKVITKHGEDPGEQRNAFAHIKSDLDSRQIKLVIEYSESLHDRCIV